VTRNHLHLTLLPAGLRKDLSKDWTLSKESMSAQRLETFNHCAKIRIFAQKLNLCSVEFFHLENWHHNFQSLPGHAKIECLCKDLPIFVQIFAQASRSKGNIFRWLHIAQAMGLSETGLHFG
jgi:hypothetical protein